MHIICRNSVERRHQTTLGCRNRQFFQCYQTFSVRIIGSFRDKSSIVTQSYLMPRWLSADTKSWCGYGFISDAGAFGCRHRHKLVQNIGGPFSLPFPHLSFPPPTFLSLLLLPFLLLSSPFLPSPKIQLGDLGAL